MIYFTEEFILYQMQLIEKTPDQYLMHLSSSHP